MQSCRKCCARLRFDKQSRISCKHCSNFTPVSSRAYCGPVFVCSGFTSPLSSLLCFVSVCDSLCCFTDDIGDPYAEPNMLVIWRSASELRRMFRTSKNWSKPHLNGSFSTDRSRWFLCCSSLSMWHLFCHCVFLISLWKAVLPDCGISWVSSLICLYSFCLIFLFTLALSVRVCDMNTNNAAHNVIIQIF